MTADVTALRRQLRDVSLRDERRLRRRLDAARRQRDPTIRAERIAALADEIAAAERWVSRRRAAVPPVSHPNELPISARTADIADAIREHQVVVVAGETGSGKTTQLPKLCLALGRGVRGRIAHTQPRRIAARTVAERIADELAVPLGGPVGYEVRFDQRSGEDTLIAVMTDGILLTAIQRDPALRAYDTIILDEAHERSLNIDFLIGYLAQMLPRRPDLKVIVTSATIDPQRFSKHFGDAPIIEVSGRMYPVEMRYRPLNGRPVTGAAAVTGDAGDAGGDADDDGERDQPEAICDAVDELVIEGPGDILVFLSGEREIRDTADALAGRAPDDTEVLPLYGRLPAAQQRRVFQPHRGRRIVLATNVAETSVTVPGVRFVIDAGYARISRYSARLKVQRLPIEKVSRASADQRAGRCGRTSDGVCIRLYSAEDYEARPRFTEPEILRTSLAAVLLAMAAAKLGPVADFPFLDPPDARQVRNGMQLLRELGAIDVDSDGDAAVTLTAVGRTLARLPIDPRLGRMLVAGDADGCLDEVLVITAALAIPDVRLRPIDARQAADTAHARFAVDGSDFLTVLALWQYLREQRQALSGNQFRKQCRAEYLHAARVREWQDLQSQLWRVARDLGMRRNDTAAQPDAVHRALLTGLLSHIGQRDGDARDYRGARGARFAIQPGSVLFKPSPRWVMAAELVETSRLWARTAAGIQPEWAERAGAHLLVRTHGDPWWSAERGAAVASERVTLYGVPLASDRTVAYAPLDAALARDLFVRHALVEGQWRTTHAFWRRNQQRLAEVAELEDKLRRRDVVVDEDVLFDFYDARVPADVVSVRHFDRWWHQQAAQQPDSLDLPDQVLFGDPTDTATKFPDCWVQGELSLPVTYRFDPGTQTDGVSVDVPLAVLGTVRDTGFDWLVPGLRGELLTALLRSLPKDVRRALVPIPDTARDVLAGIDFADGPLLDVIATWLRRERGVVVPNDAWRRTALPAHLQVTFRVLDTDGRVVGTGTDLAALQRAHAAQLQSTLGAASGIERDGLRTWAVATLPRTLALRRDGHLVTGYPALVDTDDSVAVRVLPDAAAQRHAHWAGTRRLLLLAVGSPVARITRRVDSATKLALTTNPHGGVGALLDDVLTATVDDLLARHGGLVWDAGAFAVLAATVRGELIDHAVGVLGLVAEILTAAGQIRTRLDDLTQPELAPAVADMRAQLAGLVHAGFVAAKSVARLPDVVRYLAALRRRADAAARDPARDAMHQACVDEVRVAHRALLDASDAGRRAGPAVLEIPWMIEELRISEFAQEVGTAYRVSPQRVLRAIADAR